MRRRGGTVIGLLVGVLALGLAGSGGGDEGGSASGTTAPETTSAPETTASGGGNELQLTAQGTAWDPTSFDLTAGSSYTVEVRNQDSIEHNFTFTEGNANQDIEGGEDAKVPFTAPAAGSYQFICKYHPAAMKGTITVT
jgi:plastocyanin